MNVRTLFTSLFVCLVALACLAPLAQAAPNTDFGDDQLAVHERNCMQREADGKDATQMCRDLAARYDKCSNMSGWQREIPAGLRRDETGACVPAVVCPAITGVENRSGTLVLTGCGFDQIVFFEVRTSLGYIDLMPGGNPNWNPAQVQQTWSDTEATFKASWAGSYTVTSIRYGTPQSYQNIYQLPQPVQIG
jgi:hypothetical protein